MKLFISYRRRSWGSVHLLADKLKAKIKSDIFVDYENIDDTDFERSILRHLRESDIVLVVVTEYTFSHERIHNENDWVRREIALALELGKPILLVLIDNLSPPSPSDLPKDIRDITHMHGIPFYPEYFDEAVQKLAKAVTTALATISSSQIINSPEQVNDNIVPQSNVSQLSSLTKTNYSDVPQNTTGELQEYKQYNMEANLHRKCSAELILALLCLTGLASFA